MTSPDQVSLMTVGKNADPESIQTHLEQEKQKRIELINIQLEELYAKLSVIEQQSREVAALSKTEPARTDETRTPSSEEVEMVASETAIAVESLPESSQTKIGTWLETLKRFFLGQ